ncbi:hypothetical protein Ae201684P_013090 [Aphanomyces euteiches]|nr:hypothetical protein Ae201684P_013090 [Aphanomyces euteiches]
METLLRVMSCILSVVVFCLVLVWMSAISRDSPGPQMTHASSIGILFSCRLGLYCARPILVFETKPFTHRTNKLIHATCHTLTLVSVIIGTVAVFRFHNEHNIRNLYSLHSWLGISTLVLYAMQYMFGFLVYLYPGVGAKLRLQVLPNHIAFGIGLVAILSSGGNHGEARFQRKLQRQWRVAWQERPRISDPWLCPGQYCRLVASAAGRGAHKHCLADQARTKRRKPTAQRQ